MTMTTMRTSYSFDCYKMTKKKKMKWNSSKRIKKNYLIFICEKEKKNEKQNKKAFIYVWIVWCTPTAYNIYKALKASGKVLYCVCADASHLSIISFTVCKTNFIISFYDIAPAYSLSSHKSNYCMAQVQIFAMYY